MLRDIFVCVSVSWLLNIFSYQAGKVRGRNWVFGKIAMNIPKRAAIVRGASDV